MTEPLYSRQQIQIPPQLPDLMKDYTKFILKTKPTNIIQASADYFNLLVRTTQPNKAISINQLASFYTHFYRQESTTTKDKVESVCKQIGIPKVEMNECLQLGKWEESIPWIKYWALLCSTTTTTLQATVELIADVLQDEKRVAIVPLMEAVGYLVERDPKEKGKEFMKELMASDKDMAYAELMEKTRLLK